MNADQIKCEWELASQKLRGSFSTPLQTHSLKLTLEYRSEYGAHFINGYDLWGVSSFKDPSLIITQITTPIPSGNFTLEIEKANFWNKLKSTFGIGEVHRVSGKYSEYWVRASQPLKEKIDASDLVNQLSFGEGASVSFNKSKSLLLLTYPRLISNHEDILKLVSLNSSLISIVKK